MIFLSGTHDRCILKPQCIKWGKDIYFTSGRFSSQMKAKGKTHVCFPNRSINRLWTALQAASAISQLALAMPATIALPATLLVYHRVTPALGTEITRHA